MHGAKRMSDILVIGITLPSAELQLKNFTKQEHLVPNHFSISFIDMNNNL